MTNDTVRLTTRTSKLGFSTTNVSFNITAATTEDRFDEMVSTMTGLVTKLLIPMVGRLDAKPWPEDTTDPHTRVRIEKTYFTPAGAELKVSVRVRDNRNVGFAKLQEEVDLALAGCTILMSILVREDKPAAQQNNVITVFVGGLGSVLNSMFGGGLPTCDNPDCDCRKLAGLMSQSGFSMSGLGDFSDIMSKVGNVSPEMLLAEGMRRNARAPRSQWQGTGF